MSTAALPRFWTPRLTLRPLEMTDAMLAMLPEVFDRFPVNRMVADHFEDNSASRRVLQKIGFAETGRDTAASKARLEPAPSITYAIMRETLKVGP